MPKQAAQINFARGLNQKVDPFQLPQGNFISLINATFNNVGALTKRNGFPQLSTLPHAASYLTTFNEDLTAVGATLQAYDSASETWHNRGNLQPLSLSVLPIIRNNLNQSQADSAEAPNGLICIVYTETTGSAVSYKYVVASSVTGQNIIAPTVIASATTYGTPKVFLLGNYFVIVFASGSTNLSYIAVPYLNTNLSPSTGTLSTSYTPSTTMALDGVVFNNSLILAWNGASSSGITVTILSNILIQSPIFIVDAAHSATLMSVTADTSGAGKIWITYYSSGTSNGYTLAVTPAIVPVLSPTLIITGATVLNLTSIAQSGSVTVYAEISNNYSYDSGIPTHYISAITCTSGGVTGSPYVVIRSVGLASKAFLIGTTVYFLTAYQSTYQPTYFLINGSSTSAAPVVVAKLAYQNGGGYLVTGLPNVSVSGTIARITYLFKDLLQAVNKNTNVPSGTQVNGIYSQTGINLATLDISTTGLDSAEIGSNLNLSGGFLWMYDGYLPVEQNFFLYPDSIEATWSATGGSIVAKPDGSTNTDAYFYQVTYEWTDNQGNAFRSAPSIPIPVTTTGAGTSGSISVKIPYLRLTYKTANPVKIVVYRWSVAQQIYYQTTSIFQPVLNDTTADSVAFVDTNSDATILGDNILYTTGGVVENVNGPASNIMTLFDTRLWLVDAEDRNLLWYSKQVVEGAPVEMSDLLTFYIAPNAGTTTSTGPITALAPMDDKLIIFKKDAIYYINGTGPDITGANSQYSQPIFIASSVGCMNQQSVVLTAQGLIFQSDKGIWLLDRGLQTSYIGAPVQNFNSSTVMSSLNIPETNEIRFTLSDGSQLMYDYFVGQWGEFQGISAISSTVFQGLHTFIDKFGRVFQEKPGTYLDGNNPVLISFKTGWLGMAGLRGYERIHEYSFLGTYYSPHKLFVQTAYDYGSPLHQAVYTPPNYVPPYGGQPLYGNGPYGGSNIEQFRVFAKKQKCKAFQISVQEVFDPSLGAGADQGLNLSGINTVVTLKKGWAPVSGRNSVG